MLMLTHLLYSVNVNSKRRKSLDTDPILATQLGSGYTLFYVFATGYIAMAERS